MYICYVKLPEDDVKMFEKFRNISELYVNVYFDICAVIVLNYKNGSRTLLWLFKNMVKCGSVYTRVQITYEIYEVNTSHVIITCHLCPYIAWEVEGLLYNQ